MKTSASCRRSRLPAFTLIELLVVIAVIAILAALIIPIAGALDAKKKRAVAQAELAQVEAAIEDYHAKYNFYPPDNHPAGSPNVNPIINQLYFELAGTTNNVTSNPGTATYATLDGSAQIAAKIIPAVFNVAGFANTSASAHSTDEAGAAQNFIKNLHPNQSGPLGSG